MVVGRYPTPSVAGEGTLLLPYNRLLSLRGQFAFRFCHREISSSSLLHRGRTWYILSLTLCRFLAWNYFAQLQLEVLQLTRHPENWTLQARWRLMGLPIHMLFLRFYRRDKEELYR